MSPTTVTQTLTGPQFAAITDFTDLHLEFKANVAGAVEPTPTLLLHCDGTNASTSFPDSSPSANTVTAHGAAQVATAQKEFGTCSAVFDGSTSYLTADTGTYSPTGDFTIDFWAYPTADPDLATAVGKVAASGVSIYSVRFGSGSWIVGASSSGTTAGDLVNFIAFGSAILNTWQHVALVRSGNIYTGYLNGVGTLLATSSSAPFVSSDTLTIGGALISGSPARFYTGYIDEFHFVDGTAIWTSNFTPPVNPWGTASNAGVGAASGTGAGAAVAPAVYAGPGDIVSSAARWYGLRAYTVASIGANAIRLRRDSDNTEQDIATVSGGGLDLSAISTFKGAANVFITKFYDQAGTNHRVQTNASQQAQLVLSGLGALPIAVFSRSAATSYSISASVSLAQPFTVSAVMRRAASFTTQQVAWANPVSFSIQLSFNTVADSMFYYLGSFLAATVVDSVYHAIQAVANGTSSDLNVDGIATTGDTGTSSQITSYNYMGTYDGTSYGTDGNILENGEWPVAFSPTQSSNMSANQHSYWGF